MKEALAISYHDSRRYSKLWMLTYGIVFFGVPHRGSNHAAWGRIAARIVQLFTGEPNKSFLSSVEEGSNYSMRLSERFRPLLDAFKFFSICETMPEHFGIDVGLVSLVSSKTMKSMCSSDEVGQIVQPDSAVLGLPDSQEVKLYPNRTHRTICKVCWSRRA